MIIIGGGPLPNVVNYDGSIVGEAIAIAFSQRNPTSEVQWFLDVYVNLGQGMFRLGGLITNTISVDISPNRVVGFASCPGAISWQIMATTSAGAADEADLLIVTGKCCGGSPPYGVTLPPGGTDGGNPGGGPGGGTGYQGKVES